MYQGFIFITGLQISFTMFKIIASVALLALSVNGAIQFTRTVEKIAPGGSGDVVIGNNACTQKDQYGSNDCTLDWGQSYPITYNLSFPAPITAGHTISLQAKVEGLPLTINCAACGQKCEFKIPVIGKDVSIDLPPCPIQNQYNSTTINLDKDPVPLKVSVSGSGQLKDQSGNTVDSISFTCTIAPNGMEMQAISEQ
eukprot:m.1637271 g.1637271  ORF g.1637271 m.1637271 type:complete len:197 (+) comp25649_c0_seq1:68-658(+)